MVDEYASLDELFGAEQRMLDEFGSGLAAANVLDLGVGGGRTSLHLIGRVGSYTGVDYSRAMVEACQRRFAGCDSQAGVGFQVGDARRMPEIPDCSADLVLFCFNGLDGVGDRPERMAALEEIARVCRPGGAFVFSADNLLWVRGSVSPRHVVTEIFTSDVVRRDPLVLLRRRRLLRRAVRDARRRRQLNAPAERLQASHAMVVEERPRYELDARRFDTPSKPVLMTRYSTEPTRQVADLVEAGFGAVRIFTPGGEELTHASSRRMARWRWLYYGCRRTAARPQV